MQALVDGLFRNIPSGVGSSRKDLKLSSRELYSVMERGIDWALKKGFGTVEDRSRIEAEGCIPGANPECVSDRALKRGHAQLGTLGSGNHFVEIGYIDEIHDPEAAGAFGLETDQVTVLVHTGSRGFGHQICDDYIKVMMEASRRYGIDLPDRQLCCAPVQSKEGRDYLAAMACAANFAFVNRQVITHWVRETFKHILDRQDLRLSLVYDVCHNIAKMERHEVEGREMELCVHRKGATRAFPPGHREIPEVYREIGQPVLIPDDMGRSSYVLAGTEKGYRETFGSACHGAGRVLSRRQSKKAAKGRAVIRELEDRGILVRGASKGTIVEEISEAYKDVENVVDVVHGAGIGKKVARLRPLGVIKG